MVLNEDIQAALSKAWHEETARNSIERWLQICDQEQWGSKPAHLDLLINLFGASWYFTRIVFSIGLQAVEIIDQPPQALPDRQQTVSFLAPSLDHDDIEVRMNHLRVLKNKFMLKVLVEYLQHRFTLVQLEYSLSILAEATLEIMVRSLQILPGHEKFPVTVLAMGRMAGYEMTFGSDLDLIFLYDNKDEEQLDQLGRSIRLLLRLMAQPASTGSLYDVDMRLRPHGNSGTLVTSYRAFLEYHADKRETWERQMMTRCRPVLIYSANVETVLQQVSKSLYAKYDRTVLQQDIVAMRARVQKELGSPKGKYDIKRGYGGIMDIDFISHYFQLVYGEQNEELRTCSTRQALLSCGKLGLIDQGMATDLVQNYNYLKKAELCLRLFDMKSVDAFKADASNNISLTRAMGHGNNTRQFLDEYETVTSAVRNDYLQLLV